MIALAYRFAVAWSINSWAACSQLANAVLLGGDPNESISGRAGRLAPSSTVWRVVAAYIGARSAWRLARGLEER